MDTKKPSMSTAVIFTVAAVCSLMTFLLVLTGGNTSAGLVGFALLTSVLLVISAIGNWVTYFRKRIDFEIESRQEGITTKQ
jgi:hypothetical protein